MPLFECLSFLISLFSCFWHPWVKRPPLYDNSYSPRSHWPPFYHNMPLGGKLWAKARVCRTIRWGALSKTSEQNQVLCRTESSPKKKNIEVERHDNLYATVDQIFYFDWTLSHGTQFWSDLAFLYPGLGFLFSFSYLPPPLFITHFSFWTLYLSCICHFLCIFQLWWKREGLFLDRPGLIFGFCIFIFFNI